MRSSDKGGEAGSRSARDRTLDIIRDDPSALLSLYGARCPVLGPPVQSPVYGSAWSQEGSLLSGAGGPLRA